MSMPAPCRTEPAYRSLKIYDAPLTLATLRRPHPADLCCTPSDSLGFPALLSHRHPALPHFSPGGFPAGAPVVGVAPRPAFARLGSLPGPTKPSLVKYLAPYLCLGPPPPPARLCLPGLRGTVGAHPRRGFPSAPRSACRQKRSTTPALLVTGELWSRATWCTCACCRISSVAK